DVRDLDVGHARRFGRDVRELDAAGHHTALHHVGIALGQFVVEVVRLDTEVVQTGPGAVQKLGVDALTPHRRDELELGVAGIGQGDVGDEVRRLAAIGARVRTELHTGHTDPLFRTQ